MKRRPGEPEGVHDQRTIRHFEHAHRFAVRTGGDDDTLTVERIADEPAGGRSNHRGWIGPDRVAELDTDDRRPAPEAVVFPGNGKPYQVDGVKVARIGIRLVVVLLFLS